MKWTVFFVLISLSMITTTVHAQSYTPPSATAGSSGSPAALTSGNWGLHFGLFGGNPFADGSAGASVFVSDALEVGGSLGLRLENGNDALSGTGAGPAGGDWGFLVSPYLRYFFKTGHKVVPFAIGKINLAAWDGPDDENTYLSVAGGFGAEFFPYDYFGVSGHVAANINLVEDFGLGLMTTQLRASFYF